MPAVSPTMLGARDSDANPSSGEDPLLPRTSNTVAWTVAAIVGGVLVLGSALTLVVIHYNRRRGARRRQEELPFLAAYEPFKRRKVSEAGLSQEEEERRAQLIRKSLAARSARSSRSSDSWASRSSYPTMAALEQVDRELEEMERRESTRLKDDWKRWEARIRAERSMSCGQHPAVSAAADSAAMPILAVPTPSRQRSQGRAWSQSPPPPASPPPLPARHPGRVFRD